MTLSSPIGAIIAIGGVARLEAAAVDGSGQPTSATFTWSVEDAAVATVTPSGAVTGVGPGTTVVTASAAGVDGTLGLVVADADVAGIEALLDDVADNSLTQDDLAAASVGSSELGVRVVQREHIAPNSVTGVELDVSFGHVTKAVVLQPNSGFGTSLLCPAGSRPLAGGWEIAVLNSPLRFSESRPDVGAPYGWRFNVRNDNSVPVTVTLYVVCADLT